jgi:single-stranded DNA-binding protein
VTFILVIFMLVTLSGNTGYAAKVKSIPRNDGTGSFNLAETSLAVKVSSDTSDWYKLKFVGDNLTKLASYITKGMQICIVGELIFENWTDDKGELCIRPVVNVSEIQLPRKSKII